MASLPAAPPKPPARPALIRNRAAYTADGDNPNGVQAHAYQTARQMWHQVGGYLGANMPPVSLDQPFSNGNYAVTYPNGHQWQGSQSNEGSVSLSRPMQQAMADQQNPSRDFALGTFVHELAHAFQNPTTLNTVAGREGGAEAFNRQVSPSAIAAAMLGDPGSLPVGAQGYDGYVAKALAGPDATSWVLHRQFRKGR